MARIPIVTFCTAAFPSLQETQSVGDLDRIEAPQANYVGCPMQSRAARHVGDDGRCLFKADGEPDRPGIYGHLRALHELVGEIIRDLYQGFDAAQADSGGKHTEGRYEPPGRFGPSLHFHRDHAAEASHLPAGYIMLGMALQAREMRLQNARVPIQEGCHAEGVSLVRFHADREGLHPPEE